MNDIIFKVEYGGLGDHLFYSPLPRLLKLYGMANKVYISSSSNFRSWGTYAFVWGKNPYLDGISDDKPFDKMNADVGEKKIVNIIMSEYGLVGLGKEINPEIYVDIPINEIYAKKKYLDMNYISYVGGYTPYDEYIIIRKHPELVLVNPSKRMLQLHENPYVYTKSIVDYASLIYSAEEFWCLASGGASLSAALNKQANVFYAYGQNEVFHHSINYHHKVGSSGLMRRILAKFYYKKNKIRVAKSKNK